METPVNPQPCDTLDADRRALDAFFTPKNVAVIGATEKDGSVGRTILWNLISSPFGGTVFPINPEAPERAGHQGLSQHRGRARPGRPGRHRARPPRRCPASSTSASRRASAARSSSRPASRKSGAEGAELEARDHGAGAQGQDARHRPELPGRDEPAHRPQRHLRRAAWRRPGNVGFISQSGALCTAVLDWSFRENVGFSAFVSIGSMLDVGWGDLIDYLGDDPQHQQHRHLHGIDRRRALLPVGGARGGADQADHRHQAGPHGRRRPRPRPRTPAR